jgi:large subunit ribosomal protein L22
MKAVLRGIRISPRKANLIAGMVRGKSVKESLNILKFTPKKAARILYKVVHSAAYNAKNNFKQDLDDLIITKILVTKGPTLKRSLPVSRGRSHPILKRTSHITVEVGVPEGAETTNKKTKVVKETTVTPKDEKKDVAPKKSAEKKTAKKKEATTIEEPKKEIKKKVKSKKEVTEK